MDVPTNRDMDVSVTRPSKAPTALMAVLLTVAALCVALAPGPARAADPRTGEERWLQRVVPPGLAPPRPAQIPPIAIIETGSTPAILRWAAAG